ncbi:hypothetical protein L6164_019996 [Bauhinia variegata]|uniref:Uncharacterized protein n=1 Tax=Bauhinia variegata TaxID=167791 RepID=A0ACB9MU05_BAUVA|nr:hypothetical protein L6164_019996 [Bauhinia variegata]
MGGFIPTATARIGNLTLSTAFGGFIPSLLNIQFHGFQDATVYGTTSGYPVGLNSFHGWNVHGYPQPTGHRRRHDDNVLKNLLILIGVLVLLALIFGW